MITEQQSEMIDYLIAGDSKTDIAKLLNVSRNTIYTWLDLPEVKAEKQKRLNQIKRDAKNKIATKVDSCLDVIYEIAIKSKDSRTKFQAAKYLCDQFIGAPATERPVSEVEERPKEFIDIDKMLNDLEKKGNMQ